MMELAVPVSESGDYLTPNESKRSTTNG